MRVRALSVVVLAALCSVALAQGRGQAHTKPDKKTYKATTIDTRLFFPQVVHTVTANVIDPENPVQPPDFVSGPGNGLPFGGLLNEPRTNPGFAFPGITATGWHPADPDIAVGPNNIVEVVNMSIAFYAKDGTLQLEQTAQNMFSGTGATSFDFDPKCFYDRIHDRFVILYLERSTGADPDVSKVLVAVSDDGDPNGVWFTYRIEAKLTLSSVDYWMDYPGFGYNKDAYVANGNMFSFPSNSFAGAQFVVMPSAAMLTGSPVTVTSMFDPNAGSVQTAEVIDPTEPNVFCIQRRGTTLARIYALSNLTTTPTLTSTDVAVPTNSAPSTDATSTNGNVLDTIDGRVFNAVWRGGRLLAAHNIQGATHIGTWWYEFDTGTWPTSGAVTLVQSGQIQDSSLDRFDGAINKNATGKISVLFTSSSSTVTADMTVASRLSSDPAGTLGTPSVLESSVGNNYTSIRWGDYFGVDVDPVDDVTFWGVAMLVGASNDWITSIYSWTVPGTTNQAPSFFQWIRGVQLSGNLASLAADDGDYLTARAGLVLFAGEAPAQLVTETVAPSITLFGIDVSFVAKANTPGLTQRIDIWNWTKGQYDLLGTQAATTTNSSQNVSATGPMSQYVDPATKKVRIRTSWKQTGLVLLWPWTVSVDQVSWSITSA